MATTKFLFCGVESFQKKTDGNKILKKVETNFFLPLYQYPCPYLLVSICTWWSPVNNGRYSGSGRLPGNFINSALNSCNHGDTAAAILPCWVMASRSICQPDSNLRFLAIAPSLVWDVDCVATWVTSRTEASSWNICREGDKTWSREMNQLLKVFRT